MQSLVQLAPRMGKPPRRPRHDHLARLPGDLVVAADLVKRLKQALDCESVGKRGDALSCSTQWAVGVTT